MINGLKSFAHRSEALAKHCGILAGHLLFSQLRRGFLESLSAFLPSFCPSGDFFWLGLAVDLGALGVALVLVGLGVVSLGVVSLGEAAATGVDEVGGFLGVFLGGPGDSSSSAYFAGFRLILVDIAYHLYPETK